MHEFKLAVSGWTFGLILSVFSLVARAEETALLVPGDDSKSGSTCIDVKGSFWTNGVPAAGGDLAEEVAFQHAFIKNLGLAPKGDEEVFARNAHPDAQWYPEAALGLFIHWGISSVNGWGDLSWSMIKNRADINRACEKNWGCPSPSVRVPPNVYWSWAKDFDAKAFDPDRILGAAAKAGFRYAILTTKHHDGFALWPSAVGDFNTKNFLHGRDLVGEYVAACRRQGLKVGLYYSPPDWRFDRDFMNYSRDPRHPSVGPDWEDRAPRTETPEHIAARNAYCKTQIEELLTRYGKIDMLWFDGMGSDCITVKRMRELQPGLIINDRGRTHGDFLTQDSECHFPKSRRPKSLWWEYIHTLNDGGWGYRYHECYKSAAWLLCEAAKARSWGGNFVANIGPDGHGVVPAAYYKIMGEVACWRVKNEAALHAEGTLLWPEHCSVPVTAKGDTLYLFYDYLQNGPVTCELPTAPKSVTIDGEAIAYGYVDGKLVFEIPVKFFSNLTVVVEVHR